MKSMILAGALAGCALLVGCGAREKVQDVYEDHRAEGQVESGELTTSQVYWTAVGLNQAELDLVTAVEGRLEDQGVIAFAEKMRAQHGEAIEKLQTAAKSLDEDPTTGDDGEVARDLKDETHEAVKELRDLDGDELDQEFMDRMVSSHRKALDIIDNQLLPSAKGEMLQVISEMRGHVTMHLEEAREIQDGLE